MIHRLGKLSTMQVAAAVDAAPALPTTLDLASCYRYCEALCRSRRHNYPVASLFAKSQLRPHIWAVFAFARTADDFADEPAFEGRRALELDAWEAQLRQAYRGQATHPVMVALAESIRACELPLPEFVALLGGYRMDLDVARYATFSDLRAYTAQAAEPLGHLLLYIAGMKAPRLHHYADDLSTALAFVRLLQDVPADLARGRIYLPGEDLNHFGVSEADLNARKAGPETLALMRFFVARTRALFERGRPLVDEADGDLAVELALMWHGGMAMLQNIERAGASWLQVPLTLRRRDKAAALSRAIAWRGRTLGPRSLELLGRWIG